MKRSTSLCYLLADIIVDSTTFGMDRITQPCGGSPACVAGHLAELVGYEYDGEVGIFGIECETDRAEKHIALMEEHLGMSADDARAVFFGQWTPKRVTEITAAEAAAVLRDYARTGEVPVYERYTDEF